MSKIQSKRVVEKMKIISPVKVSQFFIWSKMAPNNKVMAKKRDTEKLATVYLLNLVFL